MKPLILILSLACVHQSIAMEALSKRIKPKTHDQQAEYECSLVTNFCKKHSEIHTFNAISRSVEDEVRTMRKQNPYQFNRLLILAKRECPPNTV